MRFSLDFLYNPRLQVSPCHLLPCHRSSTKRRIVDNASAFSTIPDSRIDVTVDSLATIIH
jgi:hypothetical protein